MVRWKPRLVELARPELNHGRRLPSARLLSSRRGFGTHQHCLCVARLNLLLSVTTQDSSRLLRSSSPHPILRLWPQSIQNCHEGERTTT